VAVATCCLTREAVTTAKVTAEYKQLMKPVAVWSRQDMVIDHRREREKVTKSSSPPSVRPFQEDFLGPRSHRASAIVPTAKHSTVLPFVPCEEKIDHMPYGARRTGLCCRPAASPASASVGALFSFMMITLVEMILNGIADSASSPPAMQSRAADREG
jgi:hypothetical protein